MATPNSKLVLFFTLVRLPVVVHIIAILRSKKSLGVVPHSITPGAITLCFCPRSTQYWVDLGQKHRVMAPGVIEWGTTPKDFFERKTAMMWTTTGNLTNVKNNAKFDFGVAMLPAGKRRGSPTGGGNFHVFKKSTPAQKAASLKFIKWITSPERAAAWGIDTGYVAVRPDAWDSGEMKRYVAAFP